MFTKIRNTMKKLIVDTLGEDLAEISSGLSKGAKAAICCGAIAATAAGTNALANAGNSATDTASNKVNAPLGAPTVNAGTGQQAVYR